jgi:hypothetical protein
MAMNSIVHVRCRAPLGPAPNSLASCLLNQNAFEAISSLWVRNDDVVLGDIMVQDVPVRVK